MGCATSTAGTPAMEQFRPRCCADCKQHLRSQDERLCCSCHGKMWLKRRKTAEMMSGMSTPRPTLSKQGSGSSLGSKSTAAPTDKLKEKSTSAAFVEDVMASSASNSVV